MRTWWRGAQLALVVCSCLGVSDARAHVSDLKSICFNNLTRPSVISWTKMREYPIELEAAGVLYRPGMELEPLKSGVYIFLVSEDNELILAPKYDVAAAKKDGHGLATHKSLLKRYMRLTGRDLSTRVVAAGQFICAHGHIVQISNRSGNFRGGSEHLEFSEKILRLYNVPFSPSVKREAFDSQKPENTGHTPKDRDHDEFHLQILAEVTNHPIGGPVMSLYERLGRALTEIGGGSIEQGGGLAIGAARRTGRRHGYMNFIYPFTTVTSEDGLE